MFLGKLIGGLLGLLMGGFPGLVIGLLAGHAFDRALGQAMGFASPQNLVRIKQTFFETTFLLSGHLAKADGQVSRAEINHTEQLFSHLSLSAEQRQQAIEFFKQGAAEHFNVETAVQEYLEICGRQPQLQQTLLLFLVSLAHADQTMEPTEHAVLVRIANLLGFGAARLEQLLRMAEAQSHFHHQSGVAQAGSTLDDAYTALGVDSDVSERDLKRAYRKLMSENHPDKLIAKGVPENMIRLATERAQEISAAYDLICKHREGN